MYAVALSENSIAKMEKFDGVLVYKIKTPSYLTYTSSNSIGNRLRTLLDKLCHIHKYPLKSDDMCYEYAAQIEELIGVDTNTTVIGTYTPLEAIVAVCKVKHAHPRIKSVFYSADTLSNEIGNTGILPKYIRKALGFNWEKKIFSIVDKVLIMECHYQHYMSRKYKMYHYKYGVVNFPLIVRPLYIDNYDNNRTDLSFVYTGTLDRILRNPSFMCMALSKLESQLSFKVIVMGGGNCNDIMNEWESKTNGIIKYYGMQTHDIAIQAIYKADILLSIGNNESPMAPSKIYEYMSTGKPIVHFYSWNLDPCIEPLQKYGNALVIKMDEGSDTTAYIFDFIKKRIRLPFDIVESKFEKSTPAYTAKILEVL